MNEKPFKIITDTTCDLPKEITDNNDVQQLALTYEIDGIKYDEENQLPITEFYDKMRKGAVTNTSQIAPNTFEEKFEELINNGYDVLYIGFSSGLSGTINSSLIARDALLEKHPNAKINIVDSLCASLGEGLLVYKAIEKKKEGLSLEELTKWLEENKLHLCHNFTVDDLMFLHRGGRVSKTAAIAGSILGIKPVLHVDNEGHLIPLSKVRGRKNSLTALVDRMAEKIQGYDNTTIAISHGDALEDAKFVANLVESRFGIKNVIINHVGTVIGSHSGPGTIALFFMGNER